MLRRSGSEYQCRIFLCTERSPGHPRSPVQDQSLHDPRASVWTNSSTNSYSTGHSCALPGSTRTATKRKNPRHRWCEVRSPFYSRPPLTAALLVIAQLSVLFFRNGMAVFIKKQLDRALITGIVRNKQIGASPIKMPSRSNARRRRKIRTASAPNHLISAWASVSWPSCAKNPDHRDSADHNDSSG